MRLFRQQAIALGDRQTNRAVIDFAGERIEPSVPIGRLPIGEK
jgi:hypothetical protein